MHFSILTMTKEMDGVEIEKSKSSEPAVDEDAATLICEHNPKYLLSRKLLSLPCPYF